MHIIKQFPSTENVTHMCFNEKLNKTLITLYKNATNSSQNNECMSLYIYIMYAFIQHFL